MTYHIKGACWSTNKDNESHLEDGCVDMTYAIYNQEDQMVSMPFATKEEAETALSALNIGK